jgi:hypothetical protein
MAFFALLCMIHFDFKLYVAHIMLIEINGKQIEVAAHPLTDNYAADENGNIYRKAHSFKGIKKGGVTAYGDWEIAHLFKVKSPYTPPYLRLSFTVNKKRTLKTAHRFILECFHGIREKRVVARHLNDDCFDNRLANLEYGSMQENVDDAFRNNGNYAEGVRNGRSKLSESDVLEIRARFSNGESTEVIARDYKNMHPVSINNAALGITWAHL